MGTPKILRLKDFSFSLYKNRNYLSLVLIGQILLEKLTRQK
ncbi:hypothetical protein HMPREF9071_1138 [Capnocytophaga sp. oral taxon 338 str. F0234]|nr:hypothetical protein HMPREF9071_1138 [Capnocytophaga sp. oral taxon 338 str. F0234]